LRRARQTSARSSAPAFRHTPVTAGELPYWADPGQARRGAINYRDGGRGVYFEDPDGHLLEIITRPYGSGS
jgi:catechol 2,3-dioxygenase-like lactoylglutathione lyase family enzyme